MSAIVTLEATTVEIARIAKCFFLISFVVLWRNRRARAAASQLRGSFNRLAIVEIGPVCLLSLVLIRYFMNHDPTGTEGIRDGLCLVLGIIGSFDTDVERAPSMRRGIVALARQ
jgi:hypothetical protein